MAICAVLAGWQILILWPVWLMGVWLNRSAFFRSISFAAALPILLACEIAFLQVMTWDFAVLASLREIFPFGFGMSEWVVSDFAVGLIVVFALAAARPIAERFANGLERIAGPVKYAAGFSFTLYLFHAPAGAILVALGLHPRTSPFHMIACVAVIVVVCAIIAHFTERRAPAFRVLLERLFDRNRLSPREFTSPGSSKAPA
jgi:hypothetical protein